MNSPTRRKNIRTAAGAASLAFALTLAATSIAQTNTVTPAQYLASQPLPHFSPRHTLPHLSQWAFPFTFDLVKEMATDWGYALDVSDYRSLDNGGLQLDLADTSSVMYQCLSLCSNNPGQYVLQVNMDRDFPASVVSLGIYATNGAGCAVDVNTNTTCYWANSFNYVISPAGPLTDWTNISTYWVSPISNLQAGIGAYANVGIILNGGEIESGGVPGSSVHSWQFDPRVTKSAIWTNQWAPTNLAGMNWAWYTSSNKALQMDPRVAQVRAALPNRELYIYYYSNMNEQQRLLNPIEPASNYYFQQIYGFWNWMSDFINRDTDVPSYQDYYQYPNGTFTNNGYQLNYDLLTMHLNIVGYNINLGVTNSYNWLCGGWSLADTNQFCNITNYTGFLKCLYTAGMVGGVACYFSLPNGVNTNPLFGGGNGFASTFPPGTPPHWLVQIAQLSQVHAQFSWLTNFLYGGYLLPGNTTNAMSNDQPAYEFTNNAGDPAARVLVRKLYASNTWLITAWAAIGPDRNVTVTIPALGPVQVLARASGSVYAATTNGLSLLDPNGMLPTSVLPVPSPTLRTGPGGTH